MLPESSQISLEPFERDHYRQLAGWIPDAAFLYRFAGPGYRYPLDAAQLEQDLADPLRYAWRVLYRPGGYAIGHAQLYRNANGKSARLCRLLIGDPAYRGRGLGLEMVRVLLALCFETWQLETAALNVYDFNTGALQCYMKAGFDESGRSPVVLPDGHVCHAIHMHINREQYRAR